MHEAWGTWRFGLIIMMTESLDIVPNGSDEFER